MLLYYFNILIFLNEMFHFGYKHFYMQKIIKMFDEYFHN